MVGDLSRALLDECLSFAERAAFTDRVPSLSVAVGFAGDVVAADAWGMADVENGVAATPDTAYLLASVTKPITATAMALLVAEGLVGFDTPVDEILGFRLPTTCGARQPTVAELLGHRGGLGTFHRLFYADEPGRCVLDVRESIRRHAIIAAHPGMAIEYSNLGYGVIDEAIAQITGKEAGQVVRELVADKSGMASFHLGPEYAGPASAVAQRYGGDGVAYPVYDMETRGAALGWSTMTDLVRFGMASIPGGRLASIPEVRYLQQPPTETNPPANASFPTSMAAGGAWGLGWQRDVLDGLALIGHSGGLGGAATWLLCVPEIGLCVATASNGTLWHTTSLVVHHIVARLASDLLRRPISFSESIPKLPRVEYVAKTSLLGRWSGIAQTDGEETNLILDIGLKGITVTVSGAPSQAVSLPPGPHDLRVAARLHSPTSPRGGAIKLDLSHIGTELAGTISLTDTLSAYPRSGIREGGAPHLRHTQCVPYFLSLKRDRTCGIH
jgi:CubicO group peptidase (beta-lactamase class C family)